MILDSQIDWEKVGKVIADIDPDLSPVKVMKRQNPNILRIKCEKEDGSKVTVEIDALTVVK